MKLKYFLTLLIFLTNLIEYHLIAQEGTSDFKPTYITVRTLEVVEGSDVESWKAIEEEYYNKVIAKIDLLMSHEVLIGYHDTSLSKVKIINVFNNWGDIERMNNMRDELIEKSWPIESERRAFFERQNSFYTNYHSDEIYTSTEYGKYLSSDLKRSKQEPYIFFEKTSLLADNESDDSFKYYKEYIEHIIFNNEYIKAYHPYRHFWGADSREFVEMLVVDSFEDLELAMHANKELLKKRIPNGAKRKEFLQILDSAIMDKNSVLYKNVPSLSK